MRFGLVFLFGLFCSRTFGQAEQLVADFNAVMADKCKLEWEKKEAELSTFSNGKLIRTDEFRPDYIDTLRIEYSASENALALYCKEGYDGCIDRKVIKTKNHSRYSRLTILVTGKEEADRLAELWKKLLRTENNQ